MKRKISLALIIFAIIIMTLIACNNKSDTVSDGSGVKDDALQNAVEDCWDLMELEVVADRGICFGNIIAGVQIENNPYNMYETALLCFMDDQSVYGFIWYDVCKDSVVPASIIGQMDDTCWERADKCFYLGKLSNSKYKEMKSCVANYKVLQKSSGVQELKSGGGDEIINNWDDPTIEDSANHGKNQTSLDMDVASNTLVECNVEYINIFFPLIEYDLNYSIYIENLWKKKIVKNTIDENGIELINKIQCFVFFDNWINYVMEDAKDREKEIAIIEVETRREDEKARQEEEAKHIKYHKLWETLDGYEFQSEEDFSDFTELDLQYIQEHELSSDYFIHSESKLYESQENIKKEMDSKYYDRVLLYSSLEGDCYDVYYVDSICVFGVEYYYLIHRKWYINLDTGERYITDEKMLNHYCIRDKDNAEEYKNIEFQSHEEVLSLNDEELRYLYNTGYNKQEYFEKKFGYNFGDRSQVIYAEEMKTDSDIYTNIYSLSLAGGYLGIQESICLSNSIEIHDLNSKQFIEYNMHDEVKESLLSKDNATFEDSWAHFGYAKLLAKDESDEYKCFLFDSAEDVEELTEEDIIYLIRFKDRYVNVIEVNEMCVPFETIDECLYLKAGLSEQEVKGVLDYVTKFRFGNRLLLFSSIEDFGDGYEYTCEMIRSDMYETGICKYETEYDKTTGIVELMKYGLLLHCYRDVEYAE